MKTVLKPNDGTRAVIMTRYHDMFSRVNRPLRSTTHRKGQREQGLARLASKHSRGTLISSRICRQACQPWRQPVLCFLLFRGSHARARRLRLATGFCPALSSATGRPAARARS